MFCWNSDSPAEKESTTSSEFETLYMQTTNNLPLNLLLPISRQNGPFAENTIAKVYLHDVYSTDCSNACNK